MDYEKSEQYQLSIRLRPDGFSFYVEAPSADEGGVEVFDYLFETNRDYLEQLKEAIYGSDKLLLTYECVRVVIQPERYLLVPEELYDLECKESLFRLGLPSAGKVTIDENRLTKLDARLLFEVESELFAFLTRTFALFSLTAHVTPLLNLFFNRSRFGSQSKLFLFLSERGADLALYRGDSIQLTTFVATSSAKDLAFYLLTLWQQNQLNQEEDFLYVAGKCGWSDELIELLKRYIRRVDWITVPVAAIQEQSPLIPLEIQTLSLCE